MLLAAARGGAAAGRLVAIVAGLLGLAVAMEEVAMEEAVPFHQRVG